MNLNINSNCFMLPFMRDDMKIFITGLKKVAKSKGITQTDLADSIDKDQTTISNYFNYKTRPLDEYIEPLCQRVGESEDHIILIGRRESEPRAPEMAGEDINALIDKKLQTLTQQPDNNVLVFRSETEREHFKIMQSFDDQETAKIFNEYLAELEKLSVSEYELMLSSLKIKVKKLREKGQSDKTLGEEPLTGSQTG